MATHPYSVLRRRIIALQLTVQEQAVMLCIAEHVNWSTCDGATLYVDTIAREVKLKGRQVRNYIRRLRCDPEGAANAEALGQPCPGGRGCRHPGLLLVSEPARQHHPATYAIRLEEFAQQAAFDEMSAARRREIFQPRPARQADHGPWDRLIRRG